MAREMKDSGIEWIGKIPEHWEVKKLKYCSSFIQEKYVPEMGDLPYMGMENIVSWNGKFVETDSIYDRTDSLLFSADDILWGKLRPYLAKVYDAKQNGCCSGEFCVIRIIKQLDKRYFWNVLISSGFVTTVNQSTYGTKMPRANADFIKNIKVPVPPLNDQQRIASFLDAECARIDSVIEQTRASIEEYKKLKQAVITRAVTKGIRPDRAMKDSGIEWIGEIPVDWDMTKIKYISTEVGDGLHAAPKFEDNGLYYFINGNNLGDKQIRIKNNTNSVSEEEYSKYNQPVLSSNAILIALNGTYGLVSFYNGEKIMLGKSAGYINLFSRVKRNYVRYALLSNFSKRQMDDSLAGTTIANVSLKTIRNISITWPTENEQEEISLYLDSMCFDLDKLVAKKIQLVYELEAYKKTLIYEYVTGKKEVV